MTPDAGLSANTFVTGVIFLFTVARQHDPAFYLEFPYFFCEIENDGAIAFVKTSHIGENTSPDRNGLEVAIF